MTKIIAGLVLGFVIGAGCRWFDIPLPGPRKLVGALLIVSVTVGYIATDRMMANCFSAKGPALTQDMCGVPTGEAISRRA